MTDDIHNFERRFRAWMSRLDKIGASEKNKQLIRDFVRFSKNKKGLKYSTLSSEIGIAVQVIRRTGKDLDILTENDLYDLLDALETEHKNDYNYRKFIKVFFRWVTNGDTPRWVESIKLLKKDTPVQPSDLMTKEEVDKLLAACTDLRDKALLAVAIDTGMRIGAIGTLRIKNVEFRRVGAIMYMSTSSENNKTTTPQPFPLTWSTGYLNSWMDIHPDKKNPEAPLWVSLEGRTKGKAWTYRAMVKRLAKVVKASGIKRRIHFHLFKHQKITDMILKGFTGPQINYQGGWRPGSNRMMLVYGNFFAEDMVKSIMAHHGLSQEDAKPVTLGACPRCHAILVPNARVCHQCALVLDASLEKEREAAEREIMQKVLMKLVEDPSAKVMLKELVDKK